MSSGHRDNASVSSGRNPGLSIPSPSSKRGQSSVSDAENARPGGGDKHTGDVQQDVQQTKGPDSLKGLAPKGSSEEPTHEGPLPVHARVMSRVVQQPQPPPDFKIDSTKVPYKNNTTQQNVNTTTQQSINTTIPQGAKTATQPRGGQPTTPSTTMIKQPQTRPISQEQLVAEVKGIYAGLVMVESKCIEVDAQQMKEGSTLTDEQWQALIALHRTLLHEHHDFFLASQHPSASIALQRLASKYAMPARMWRHGIHAFLELLRHRLPGSLEHMLTFIYLAYSMIALLYETVPVFEETWIECLGDLGRYRMAIEDHDMHTREVWTMVSWRWYSQASDRSPTTGRLYHHLAILARPKICQQLFYYSKSLCVAIPFRSTKESILTLFNPIMEGRPYGRPPPAEISWVKINGITFLRGGTDKLQAAIEEFIPQLDNLILRSSRRFQETGYYMAITLGCNLIGFGLSKQDGRENPILSQIAPSIESDKDEQAERPVSSDEPAYFQASLELASKVQGVVLQRPGDSNVLQFVYCFLVFVFHLCHYPTALALVEGHIQWELFADLLNTLTMERPDLDTTKLDQDIIPVPPKEEKPTILPELHALRGILFATKYLDDKMFENGDDAEDRGFELPSMLEVRKDHIIALAFRIARMTPRLGFDKGRRKFSGGDVSESASVATASSFSMDGTRTPTSSQDEQHVDQDVAMIDASDPNR